MQQIYISKDGQQQGPYTLEELDQMLQSEAVTGDDLYWHEGADTWRPVSQLPGFVPPPAVIPPAPKTPPVVPVSDFAPSPATRIEAAKTVETNVKQGAVIGGWACFAIGVTLMFLSMWSFFIYGPLFFVAFVLSIVAMAQRRILGGIILLLATLLVPAILGLVLFGTRTAKLAKDLSEKSQREKVVAVSTEPRAEQAATVPNALPLASTTPLPTPALPKYPAPDAPTTPLPTPALPKYPALDAKNGFRTFQLGAPFASFATVKLDRTSLSHPDQKAYFVRDVEKTIGNAKIDFVALVFNQDLLEEIHLGAKGQQNNLGLREALIAAYGEPATKKEFRGERLIWNGEKTQLFFQSLSDGASAAVFSNKAVSAKIAELIKQKAKAGAVDGAKNL